MTTIELKCNYCSSIFIRPINFHNRSVKRGASIFFCSQSCHGKYRKQTIEVNCCYCNNQLIRKKSTIKYNTFCNKSCAAKYNNKKYPKRLKTQIKQCEKCNNKVSNTRNIHCRKCIKSGFAINKINLDRTIFSMTKHNGANKYSRIRQHARDITKNWPKKCQFCSYDKHVETCHKKSIGSFPLTATLAEVNSSSNLLLLCPNCHWEFDHRNLVAGAGLEPAHNGL